MARYSAHASLRISQLYQICLALSLQVALVDVYLFGSRECTLIPDNCDIALLASIGLCILRCYEQIAVVHVGEVLVLGVHREELLSLCAFLRLKQLEVGEVQLLLG